MYLPCISSVFLPLYSVHSDVLYGCVSCMYRRCIVMYRSCAWCPRLCYYIDTCGGIDFLQYWTIQCRIQVSYMYQMYCESLGGNSVVSQLALMSARCLGRRDLPTLLAYYPYYCILPLPPTPASYYPYYPCLLPLLPVLPLLPPTIPLLRTPRTAYYPSYRLLPLAPPTTPYYPYYPLRTVPLLPLLPPITPATPTTPIPHTTPQREVHVSCMYSACIVLVLCMVLMYFCEHVLEHGSSFF